MNKSLIYAGIVFVLLICLATYVSFRVSESLQQEFDETLTIQIRKQSMFDDQIRFLQERFVLLRDIVTTEDPFDKDELIVRHGALASKFIQLRQEFDQMQLTDKEQELLDLQREQTRKGYNLQVDLIDRSILETSPEHYQEIITTIQPLLEEVYTNVLVYRAEIQEITRKKINKAKEDYKGGWTTILLFYFLATVLGISVLAILVWSQRHQRKLLHWQATHDVLTGLSNRIAFEEVIAQQIKQPVSEDGSALLYIDLDKFKYVNDTCGHEAGDELLKKIAVQIQSTIRDSDLAARIGGDEFGVILLGCNASTAIDIAESIRKSIRQLDFVWHMKHFEIGASIGISALDSTITEPNQAVKQADAACYTAKDMGRDKVHVYAQTDTESARRLDQLEKINQVHEALKNEKFHLYRQRISALDGVSSNNYEILLRLPLDNGQILLPDEFLPAAESYNLMPDIDHWVLKSVLKNIQENRESDELYYINISGTTLNNQASQDDLLDTVRNADIGSSKLCFEVTETSAIRDISHTSQFLHQLRSMGCLIALDYFGTGLSSFTYLKQLPIDFLKIDGTFIQDLDQESQDFAFVKAMQSVGSAMGIQTIAEWVESEDTLNLLKAMDIDYAQGFHIDRPEPFIV